MASTVTSEGKQKNAGGTICDVLNQDGYKVPEASNGDEMQQALDTSDCGLSPFDRSIDVRIAQLRKQLHDSARNPTFIRTVRNLGYMFLASVQFLTE